MRGQRHAQRTIYELTDDRPHGLCATEEYERVQGADPGSEHDADDRKDGERRRNPGRDVCIYDRGRNDRSAGCKVTVTEVDAGAAKDTAITVSGTEQEAKIDEGRRSATVTTITKWENAKEEVQAQVRIENVYEKDTEEPIPPVDEPKEPGDEPNTSETETPDRPKTDAVVLSTLLFGMALLSGSIVIVLKKKKALR